MHDSNANAGLFEQFISRPQLCENLGITQRTAELWAHARKGPKVTILANRAFYHRDDVAKWLEECRRKSAERAPRKRGAA